MTGTGLDALLRAPLTDIADEGFSRQVLLRISEERLKRERRTSAALAIAGAMLACVLPFTDFGELIQQQAVAVGETGPAALAFGALVLTFLGAEALARRA